MPWPRNDPDPLEEMRRQLAEKERLVAEKMSQLTRQMHLPGEPEPPPVVKPVEPPVWRLEEDTRPVEPRPVRRRRHLGRQNQRDMLVFFIALGVLFLVVTILVWVAYVHNNAPPTGL